MTIENGGYGTIFSSRTITFEKNINGDNSFFTSAQKTT